MDTQTIREDIGKAKDSVGVISKDSMEKAVGSFSATDWRQAAAAFAPKSGQQNGFYITDTAQGEVTIHNDLTQAKHVQGSSFVQLIQENSGSDAFQGLAGAASFAGVVATGTGLAELASGAAVGAAAIAGSEIILPALGVGLLGAAVIGSANDVLKTNQQKSDAVNDLAHNQTVTFQTK